MKKLIFLPLFLFVFSSSAFAQTTSISIVGKYTGAFSGADGKPMAFIMTITDASYQFDFGGDGTAEITGAYTTDGANQITIWDTTAAEQACPSDQKGVYKYSIEGDTVTFTKISDACTGRGDEPLVLKRM